MPKFGDATTLESSNFNDGIKTGADEEGVFVIGGRVSTDPTLHTIILGGMSTTVSSTGAKLSIHNTVTSPRGMAIFVMPSDLADDDDAFSSHLSNETTPNNNLIRINNYNRTDSLEEVPSSNFVIGVGAGGQKLITRQTDITKELLNSFVYAKNSETKIIMACGIYDGFGLFGDAGSIINICNIDVENSTNLVFTFDRDFDDVDKMVVFGGGSHAKDSSGDVGFNAHPTSFSVSEARISLDSPTLFDQYLPSQTGVGMKFVLALGTASIDHFGSSSNIGNINRLLSAGAFDTEDILLSAGRVDINTSGAPRTPDTRNLSNISSVTSGSTGVFVVTLTQSYTGLETMCIIAQPEYTIGSTGSLPESNQVYYVKLVSAAAGTFTLNLVDKDDTLVDLSVGSGGTPESISFLVLGT